jgi:hypothetical protein
MPIQKVGTDDDEQFKTAMATVLGEVRSLPVTVAPGPMVVASVEDELKILEEQKAQGYSVVKREFVRDQERLYEDITLEKPGDSRKLRLGTSLPESIMRESS